MKIQLRKTNLKTLSQSHNVIENDMTPEIAGGSSYQTYRCAPESVLCSNDCFSAASPDQACHITGIC